MNAHVKLTAWPLIDQLAAEWRGLTADDRALIEDDYPDLVRLLCRISDTEGAYATGRQAPVQAKQSLTAALDLADHVSPSPTEAHAALQVLRQALADALAMSVDELRHQSIGYPADRI